MINPNYLKYIPDAKKDELHNNLIIDVYYFYHVKSEPGAARLGCPAAACGKPVCDAPCHPPPPGREPGPCGVPAPAEWCLVWCGPVLAHRPEMILVGMVTD